VLIGLSAVPMRESLYARPRIHTVRWLTPHSWTYSGHCKTARRRPSPSRTSTGSYVDWFTWPGGKPNTDVKSAPYHLSKSNQQRQQHKCTGAEQGVRHPAW
jgi:hypothetical protein